MSAPPVDAGDGPDEGAPHPVTSDAAITAAVREKFWRLVFTVLLIYAL
jgi:hypothetical protein